MDTNTLSNIFLWCMIYEINVSQDSESHRFEMPRLVICLTVPTRSDPNIYIQMYDYKYVYKFICKMHDLCQMINMFKMLIESLRFEMSRLVICLTVPIKSDYQSTVPVKIFNGQISSNHKLFRVTGNLNFKISHTNLFNTF